MKTVLRAVVTLVATASIVLAGAAGVHAASPTPSDHIGGTLSATEHGVSLTSLSTVTANVEMTPDGPFTLTPSSFTVEPGETITMTVDGNPSGRVAALMSVLAPTAGETASVTLEVAFPKPAPPAFPWPLVVGVVLVIAVALSGFYGLRRVRSRYAFAVTRKES